MPVGSIALFVCRVSLLLVMLGDLRVSELFATHRLLGPLYFILYVLVVLFVLLSVFLAIVADTYSVVRAEVIRPGGFLDYKRGVSRTTVSFRSPPPPSFCCIPWLACFTFQLCLLTERS